MNAATAGLLGTALGALASGATAVFITHITKRSEERRHFRELGLKVALTNFEYCMKLAQSAADRYKQMIPVPPLKAFVIQGIKLMEIVSDETLSADEMARRIAASEDFTQTIVQAAKQKH
jgi:hypothetical protein